MNTRKLLLIGKSASGKDTLRDMLIKRGLKVAISYTSRPRRPNEIDGINYHYVTLGEFEKLEDQNFFLESEPFKVDGGEIWKYGRSYESIENGDIFIATVTGASNMIKKTNREQFFIVELFCDTDSRIKRAKLRGDQPEEMYRRLAADDADFSAPRDFEIDMMLDTTNIAAYDQFIENWFSGKLHVSSSHAFC